MHVLAISHSRGGVLGHSLPKPLLAAKDTRHTVTLSPGKRTESRASAEGAAELPEERLFGTVWYSESSSGPGPSSEVCSLCPHDAEEHSRKKALEEVFR